MMKYLSAMSMDEVRQEVKTVILGMTEVVGSSHTLPVATS